MTAKQPLKPVLRPLIRRASTLDGPVIAEFNRLLARSTESRQLPRDRVMAGVAALLDDPAKGTYYVAEHDARIVGQLLITREWSDWRNGWFWWIQSVFVLEPYRRRGVFRALVDHIREQAANRADVCGVRLYVEKSNRRAQAVYRRMGMTRTSYQLYEIDFSAGGGAVPSPCPGG